MMTSDPLTGGYSYEQGLEYYNPVAMLNERTRDGKTNDIVLNLRATLKIIDDLTWDNFVSTQKSEWEENSYKTQFYPTILGLNGEAKIANSHNSNSQFGTMLTMVLPLVAITFRQWPGIPIRSLKKNSSYVGNYDFDTDVFYNNIAAGSYFREGKGEMGSYKEGSTLIALFGRVMYNFDERFLATASLRREGSSKFGENNKWGWFPAVSFGWRMDQESFIKDIQWIDNLKFRVGYGVTGNQDFAPYQSLILLERVGKFIL